MYTLIQITKINNAYKKSQTIKTHNLTLIKLGKIT